MLWNSALTWLDLLYDAKPDSLDLRDRESDVTGIVAEVMTYNAPFRPADKGEGETDEGHGDAKSEQGSDVPATIPDRPQRS